RKDGRTEGIVFVGHPQGRRRLRHRQRLRFLHRLKREDGRAGGYCRWAIRRHRKTVTSARQRTAPARARSLPPPGAWRSAEREFTRRFEDSKKRFGGPPASAPLHLPPAAVSLASLIEQEGRKDGRDLVCWPPAKPTPLCATGSAFRHH